MRLKSFYGQNMTEVMRTVRDSLGDNAIIVATRDDEMGGVRVTVAIDDPASSSSAPKSPSVSYEQEGSQAIELIAKALLQHQVPPALAERLLATATQYASEDPLLALGAALDTHFKFELLADDPPGKPLIFIGPPGAGKTLCVAKFATKAVMAHKKVAVISTDTERAGGMAQLAALARVLGQDILEIEDSHALRDAVSIQAPGTLVLIDTAGCNPFAQADRQTLATFIKASGAYPVMVLPADLDALEAIDMAKEFTALGAQSFLPTRLDMTRRVGGLMRTAYEAHVPLCHFSASSSVTQAPGAMNPVSLARLVLPQESSAKNQKEQRSA